MSPMGDVSKTPIMFATQSRPYIETRRWINSVPWVEVSADTRATTSAPVLWVWLSIQLGTEYMNGQCNAFRLNLGAPQSNSRQVPRWIFRTAIMANPPKSSSERERERQAGTGFEDTWSHPRLQVSVRIVFARLLTSANLAGLPAPQEAITCKARTVTL